MSREQKGYRAPCGTENSNRASTLFHIPPQGLGTPFTESLTGLIARESLVYEVPPGRLIRYTIAPAKQGSQFSPLWSGDYRYVNGVGPNARWWAEALEGLTQNRNLKYLTMLTWAEVISPIGLLRSSQAWCPECLRKWKDNGEVYDPLLWMIGLVRVCPDHGVFLVTRCPTCGREIPVLQWKYKPGLCPYCRTDLSRSESVEPDKSGSDRDLWYAKAVGELIAAAPTLKNEPSLGHLVSGVKALIESGIPVARLERIVGVSGNVLKNWAPDKAVRLETLLKVSSAVRIPLVALLTEPRSLSSLSEAAEAARLEASATLSAHVRSSNDPDFYTKYLTSILDEDPPPSLKEAADRIDRSTHTLYLYSRNLCKAVTARHQQWMDNQRPDGPRQLQPDQYRPYLRNPVDSTT